MKKQEYLQVLVELNKLKLPGDNAMNVRYNQGVEAAKKLLREFVEEKRRRILFLLSNLCCTRFLFTCQYQVLLVEFVFVLKDVTM